jgi:hypothetical protein
MTSKNKCMYCKEIIKCSKKYHYVLTAVKPKCMTNRFFWLGNCCKRCEKEGSPILIEYRGPCKH